MLYNIIVIFAQHKNRALRAPGLPVFGAHTTPHFSSSLLMNKHSKSPVVNSHGSPSLRVKVGENGEKSLSFVGGGFDQKHQASRRTSDASPTYHREASQPRTGDRGPVRERRTAHPQARGASRRKDQS